ncbi:MAG TPA: response regulator, partial [Candidatus Omnitrophota bacterium]|nr:response regulator [Candidatus Omnitrophota bacterium]
MNRLFLSKKGTAIRSIAMLVAVLFLFSEICSFPSQALANTPIKSIVPGGEKPTALSGQPLIDESRWLPPELGTISEVYRAQRETHSAKTTLRTPNSDLPAVIYVQDAHDSLEAQESIAKIIKHLTENYGVRTVFEEGYEGPVPTGEFFGFIKDPELKRKVSYFFLDHLRIGGAEYAHINRKTDDGYRMTDDDSPAFRHPTSGIRYPDWTLIGADSLKLHKENVDQYRFSAEKKEAIAKDLRALEKEVRLLTDARFPKEFREWLRLREQFDAKKLDLFTYLSRTMLLSPGSTPGHRSQGSQVKLRGLSGATVPLVSFILEAVKTNDPVVIEKAKHIDAREVFAELSKLDESLAEAYLAGAGDKELFGHYKTLCLLGRLSDLQVSQEEYEVVRQALRTFNTRSLGEFIHANVKKPIVLSRQWERNIREAVKFYEIAAERDGAISKRLDEYFLSGNAQRTTRNDTSAVARRTSDSKLLPAILIYGGFHKENIKRILESKGISYGVVSPKITKPSLRHEGYYNKLMTEGFLSFEKPFVSVLATAARVLPVFHPSLNGRAEVRAVYEALRVHPGTDLGTLDRLLGKGAPSVVVKKSRAELRETKDVTSVAKDVPEKGNWLKEQWKRFVFRWTSAEGFGYYRKFSGLWYVVGAGLFLGSSGIAAGLIAWILYEGIEYGFHRVGMKGEMEPAPRKPAFGAALREKAKNVGKKFSEMGGVPVAVFLGLGAAMVFAGDVPGGILQTLSKLSFFLAVREGFGIMTGSLLSRRVILTAKGFKGRSDIGKYLVNYFDLLLIGAFVSMPWVAAILISIYVHEIFHYLTARYLNAISWPEIPLKNLKIDWLGWQVKFTESSATGIPQRWFLGISSAGTLGNLFVAAGALVVMAFDPGSLWAGLFLKYNLWYAAGQFLFLNNDFGRVNLLELRGRYLSEWFEPRMPRLGKVLHVRVAPVRERVNADSFLLETSTGRYWLIKTRYARGAANGIDGFEYQTADEADFKGESYSLFEIVQAPGGLLSQLNDPFRGMKPETKGDSSFSGNIRRAELRTDDGEFRPNELRLVDPKAGLRRVLIVEDRENIRELLKTTLTAEERTVVMAVNGNEAMEYFEKNSGNPDRLFDLVITDTDMPLMNGDVLIRQLRERFKFRGPILWYSGEPAKREKEGTVVRVARGKFHWHYELSPSFQYPNTLMVHRAFGAGSEKYFADQLVGVIVSSLKTGARVSKADLPPDGVSSTDASHTEQLLKAAIAGDTAAGCFLAELAVRHEGTFYQDVLNFLFQGGLLAGMSPEARDILREFFEGMIGALAPDVLTPDRMSAFRQLIDGGAAQPSDPSEKTFQRILRFATSINPHCDRVALRKLFAQNRELMKRDSEGELRVKHVREWLETLEEEEEFISLYGIRVVGEREEETLEKHPLLNVLRERFGLRTARMKVRKMVYNDGERHFPYGVYEEALEVPKDAEDFVALYLEAGHARTLRALFPGELTFKDEVERNVSILGEIRPDSKPGNKEIGFEHLKELGLDFPPGIVLSAELVCAIVSSAKEERDLSKSPYIALIEEQLAKAGIGPNDSLMVRSNPKVSMPGVLTSLPVNWRERLIDAILAAAKAWDTDAARDYRQWAGIPHRYDLPLIIQRLERGFDYASARKGKTLRNFAGAFTTRDPKDGRDGIVGRFEANVMGEHLMTEGGEGRDIRELATAAPKIYRQILDAKAKIDGWLRPRKGSKKGRLLPPQELEFTVVDGKLWFLQMRNMKFSIYGEIAHLEEDMAEGRITETLAIPRIEALQARLGQRKIYKVRAGAQVRPLARALTSNSGAFRGPLVFDPARIPELVAKKKPFVWFALKKNIKSSTKNTDLLIGLLGYPSFALVTEYGNGSSHEAVLTRSVGIASLINLRRAKVVEEGSRVSLELEGGVVLHEGDPVIVDGDHDRLLSGPADALEESGVELKASYGIHIPSFRKKFLKPYLTAEGQVRAGLTGEEVKALHDKAMARCRDLKKGKDAKAAYIANLEQHFLHDLLTRMLPEEEASRKTGVAAPSGATEVPAGIRAAELADLLEKVAESGEGFSAEGWTLLEKNIAAALGLDEASAGAMIESIMNPLIPPASPQKIGQLFDPDFVPGTFMVGERLHRPPFLAASDNQNLRKWVGIQIAAELVRWRKAADKESDPAERLRYNKILEFVGDKEREWGIPLGDAVFLLLFLRDGSGKRFMDMIPAQIYQDVFTRAMSKLTSHHTYNSPYSDKDFNEKIGKVIETILPRMENLSIEQLFRYSIAAGALGLDLKSSSSAASITNTTNIIPYYVPGESDRARSERILRVLGEKAARPLAIDFWPDFEAQFIKSKTPKTLVVFHDDYGEAQLDLLFILKMLQENPLLKVISVPRHAVAGWIRVGNDAHDMDFINKFLTMPSLAPLSRIMAEEGRYQISRSGPLWGAVNGREFSEEVADLVLNSDAILVQGARSYETLQGINKTAYFAFMVCREFSESVTGVDAFTGDSVFIKQNPGLLSFQGFRERHTRSIPLAGPGRRGWAASMTATEYARAVRSPAYPKIVGRFRGDELAADHWIKQEASKSGKTIAQFILKGAIRAELRSEEKVENAKGAEAFKLRITDAQINEVLENKYAFRYLPPSQKEKMRRLIRQIPQIPVRVRDYLYDGGQFGDYGLKVQKVAEGALAAASGPGKTVPLSDYLEAYVDQMVARGFRLVRIEATGSWTSGPRDPGDIDFRLEFEHPNVKFFSSTLHADLVPEAYPEGVAKNLRVNRMELLVSTPSEKYDPAIEDSVTLFGPVSHLDPKKADVERVLVHAKHLFETRTRREKYSDEIGQGGVGGFFDDEFLVRYLTRGAFLLHTTFPDKDFAARANRLLNDLNRYYDMTGREKSIPTGKRLFESVRSQIGALEQSVSLAIAELEKARVVPVEGERGYQREQLPVVDPATRTSVAVEERAIVHREGLWHESLQGFIFRKSPEGRLQVLRRQRSQSVHLGKGRFDLSVQALYQPKDRGSFEKVLRRALKEQYGLEDGGFQFMQIRTAGWLRTHSRYKEDPSIHSRQFASLGAIFLTPEAEKNLRVTDPRVGSIDWVDWEDYVGDARNRPEVYFNDALFYALNPAFSEEVVRTVRAFGHGEKVEAFSFKTVTYYNLAGRYDVYVFLNMDDSVVVSTYDRETHTTAVYDRVRAFDVDDRDGGLKIRITREDGGNFLWENGRLTPTGRKADAASLVAMNGILERFNKELEAMRAVAESEDMAKFEAIRKKFNHNLRTLRSRIEAGDVLLPSAPLRTSAKDPAANSGSRPGDQVIVALPGTFELPHLDHIDALLDALVFASEKDRGHPKTYVAVLVPMGDHGKGPSGNPTQLPFKHREAMSRRLTDIFSPLMQTVLTAEEMPGRTSVDAAVEVAELNRATAPEKKTSTSLIVVAGAKTFLKWRKEFDEALRNFTGKFQKGAATLFIRSGAGDEIPAESLKKLPYEVHLNDTRFHAGLRSLEMRTHYDFTFVTPGVRDYLDTHLGEFSRFFRFSSTPFKFQIDPKLVERSLAQNYAFRYWSPERRHKVREVVRHIPEIPVEVRPHLWVNEDFGDVFKKAQKATEDSLYAKASQVAPGNETRYVSLSRYMEAFVHEMQERGFRMVRLEAFGSWVGRARVPSDFDLILEFRHPSSKLFQGNLKARLLPELFPDALPAYHKPFQMDLFIMAGNSEFHPAIMDSVTLMGEPSAAEPTALETNDVLKYADFLYNRRMLERSFGVAIDGDHMDFFEDDYIARYLTRSAYILQSFFPDRGFSERANRLLDMLDGFFDFKGDPGARTKLGREIQGYMEALGKDVGAALDELRARSERKESRAELRRQEPYKDPVFAMSRTRDVGQGIRGPSHGEMLLKSLGSDQLQADIAKAFEGWTPDEIRRLFDEYQLGELRAISFFTHNEKTLPVLETSKGKFCIKPITDLDPVGKETQMLFVAEVIHRNLQRGVPIPVIYRSGEKDAEHLIFRIKGGSVDAVRYFMVERWIAGYRSIKREEATPEMMGEVARWLARIHSATAGVRETEWPKLNRWVRDHAFDDMENSRRIFRENIRKNYPPEDSALILSLLDEAFPKVREALRKISRQPINSDINFANLFFDDAGKIREIIDWEASRFGYRIEDFTGLLFRSGRGGAKAYVHGTAEELLRALKAYQKEAGTSRLSDEELDILPWFFLVDFLDTLYFRDRGGVFGEGQRSPSVQASVMQTIRRIQKDFAPYFSGGRSLSQDLRRAELRSRGGFAVFEDGRPVILKIYSAKDGKTVFATKDYKEYFGKVYTDVADFLRDRKIDQAKAGEVIRSDQQSIVIGIPSAYSGGTEEETKAYAKKRVAFFETVLNSLKILRRESAKQEKNWNAELVINVNGLEQGAYLAAVLQFQKERSTSEIPVTVIHMPLAGRLHGREYVEIFGRQVFDPRVVSVATRIQDALNGFWEKRHDPRRIEWVKKYREIFSGKTNAVNAIVEYARDNAKATILGLMDDDIGISDKNILSNVLFLIDSAKGNNAMKRVSPVMTTSRGQLGPSQSEWDEKWWPERNRAPMGPSMFSFLFAFPPLPSYPINEDVYLGRIYYEDESVPRAMCGWRVIENPSGDAVFRWSAATNFRSGYIQNYRYELGDRWLTSLRGKEKQKYRPAHYGPGAIFGFWKSRAVRDPVSGKIRVGETYRKYKDFFWNRQIRINYQVFFELLFRRIFHLPLLTTHWATTVPAESKTVAPDGVREGGVVTPRAEMRNGDVRIQEEILEQAEVIVWDFDNTIFGVEEVWEAMEAQIIAKIWVKNASEMITGELLAEARRFFQESLGISDEQRFTLAAQRVSSSLDEAATIGKKYATEYFLVQDAYVQKRLAEWKTNMEQYLIPGALENLDEYHRRGIKQYLLSGNHYLTRKILDELGLSKYFVNLINAREWPYSGEFSKATALERLSEENQNPTMMVIGDGLGEIKAAQKVAAGRQRRIYTVALLRPKTEKEMQKLQPSVLLSGSFPNAYDLANQLNLRRNFDLPKSEGSAGTVPGTPGTLTRARAKEARAEIRLGERAREEAVAVLNKALGDARDEQEVARKAGKEKSVAYIQITVNEIQEALTGLAAPGNVNEAVMRTVKTYVPDLEVEKFDLVSSEALRLIREGNPALGLKPNPDRARHMIRAERFFRALATGNTEYFVRRLASGTSDADKEGYRQNLRRLKAYFETFTPAERTEMWLEIKLHDTGYTSGATDAGHEERGGIFAEQFIRGELSLPSARAEAVSRLIRRHMSVGLLSLGELRYQKFMEGLDEKGFLKLVLHNIVDASAVLSDSMVYYPARLATVVGWFDPKTRQQSLEVYDQYRFEKLAKTSGNSEKDLTPGEILSLNAMIRKIFGQEEEMLRKQWRDAIDMRYRLVSVPTRLVKYDASYKRFAKWMRLLAHVSLLVPGGETVFTGNLLSREYPPLEIEDAMERIAIKVAADMDRIPEDSDLTAVQAQFRELPENKRVEIYGIPFVRNGNEVLIDVASLFDEVGPQAVRAELRSEPGDDVQAMASKLKGLPTLYANFPKAHNFNQRWHQEGRYLQDHIGAMLKALRKIEGPHFRDPRVPWQAIIFIRRLANENRARIEAACFGHDIGKVTKYQAKKMAVGDIEQSYSFHEHENDSYEVLSKNPVRYGDLDISGDSVLLLSIKHHALGYSLEKLDGLVAFVRDLRRAGITEQKEIERACEFLIALATLDMMGSYLDAEGRDLDMTGISRLIGTYERYVKTEVDPAVLAQADRINFKAQHFSRSMAQVLPAARKKVEAGILRNLLPAITDFYNSGRWKKYRNPGEELIQRVEGSGDLMRALRETHFFDSPEFLFGVVRRHFLSPRPVLEKGRMPRNRFAHKTIGFAPLPGSPEGEDLEKGRDFMEDAVSAVTEHFSDGKVELPGVKMNRFQYAVLRTYRMFGPTVIGHILYTGLVPLGIVVMTYLGLHLFGVSMGHESIGAEFLVGVGMTRFIFNALEKKVEQFGEDWEKHSREQILISLALGVTAEKKRQNGEKYEIYFRDIKELYLAGSASVTPSSKKLDLELLEEIKTVVWKGLDLNEKYFLAAREGYQLALQGGGVDLRAITVAMLAEIASHNRPYFDRLTADWTRESRRNYFQHILASVLGREHEAFHPELSAALMPLASFAKVMTSQDALDELVENEIVAEVTAGTLVPELIGERQVLPPRIVDAKKTSFLTDRRPEYNERFIKRLISKIRSAPNSEDRQAFILAYSSKLLSRLTSIEERIAQDLPVEKDKLERLLLKTELWADGLREFQAGPEADQRIERVTRVLNSLAASLSSERGRAELRSGTWDEVKGAFSERLRQLPPRGVLLVAGPSATGKSWMLNEFDALMAAQGRKIEWVPEDRYFKPEAECPLRNGKPDFDHIDAYDLAAVARTVQKFHEDGTAVIPASTFGKPEPAREPVLGSKDVIGVEGLHTLHPKLTAAVASDVPVLKVYLDTPWQIRFMRRLWRDVTERQFKDPFRTLALWDNVAAGEKDFVEPTKANADFVIRRGSDEEARELGVKTREFREALSKRPEVLARKDYQEVLSSLEDYLKTLLVVRAELRSEGVVSEGLQDRAKLESSMRQVMNYVAAYPFRAFPFSSMVKVGGMVVDQNGKGVSLAVNGLGQQHAERMAIVDALDKIFQARQTAGVRFEDAEKIKTTIDYLRFSLKISRYFPEADLPLFTWVNDRLGDPMGSMTLFVTMAPCEWCEKLIMSAGIKNVVYGYSAQRAAGREPNQRLIDNGIRVTGGILFN